MTADAAPKRTWTPEEYLAAERAAPRKHEFFAGEVFAMAGSSEEHNLIVGNIVGELRSTLRERPCKVYPSDMRVKIPASGLYTYPDVSVVCDRPQLEDDKGDTLLNPLAIFEVLSDSTEDYDRGTKFTHYRSIPSLREYVLVSQDRVFVEHFSHHADGSWLLREYRAGERLVLQAIDCALDVDEIYLKVFAVPDAAEA